MIRIYILHSVSKLAFVLSLYSLTKPAMALNLDQAHPLANPSLRTSPLPQPQTSRKERNTYSAMPASPIHSYNQLSLVVTTAPSLASRRNATGTSSALQLLTPSASTYTLCPCASRSSVVCVTQMCASMPTTTISRCAPLCGGAEESAVPATEPRPDGAPDGIVPDDGVSDADGAEKCRAICGIHIEKAVLSTCSAVGCVLSRPSSVQVAPRRERFCVVA